MVSIETIIFVFDAKGHLPDEAFDAGSSITDRKMHITIPLRGRLHQSGLVMFKNKIHWLSDFSQHIEHISIYINIHGKSDRRATN